MSYIVPGGRRHVLGKPLKPEMILRYVGSVYTDGILRGGAIACVCGVQCDFMSAPEPKCLTCRQCPYFFAHIIEHMFVYLMRSPEINMEATTCTSHQEIHNITVDFNLKLSQCAAIDLGSLQ